ncbi:PA0069 family radical SAM protein [Robiginitomaculum antarcticum]|uniref:PA0069 family radical SAM protein n=1 Tax=Robiginitomaculum antarcticum TaxID=437507 RepID=UPI00037AB59E|nr:PA0069 family radical SAM protein [Robiginitomaculum antarcticum]
MTSPHFIPFTPPKRGTENPLREKGRAARSNDSGRYEPVQRQRFDDGWNSLADDDRIGRRTTVTIEKPKTIINKVTSPYVGFDRSINPYRGCEHGCIYCFARPTHAYHGLSPGLDFETRLFAKPDAPKLLIKELCNPNYRVRSIAVGTNMDAYQPIERRMEIIRNVLKVLSDFHHPVSILTKSDLITRDLDILAPMGEKNLTRCMISITTQDRALARAMEPRCPTPENRFEALKKLADAGVSTGIMLGPMIPGLNDSELESIMERAVSLGASYSAYTILRLPQEVSPLFQEWLEVFAPARAKRIMNHIRTMNGGKDYDPAWSRGGEVKTPFAQLIAQRYALCQRRTGLVSQESSAHSRHSLDCTQFRIPSSVSGQKDLFDI